MSGRSSTIGSLVPLMTRVSKSPEELVKTVNSLTAFSFRPGEEVLDGLQFGHCLGVAATGCDLDL